MTGGGVGVPPPVDDDDVPRFWSGLGLPGLVDVHVHFMPERVQAAVWSYFADAETHYGAPWPITYRGSVEERLGRLDRLGVRAFSALNYPHRPGMAAWLNDWSGDFAAEHPQVLRSATFFPEPEAAHYVPAAIEAGARVFKVHVQVGGFDPRHELLDPVWTRLEQDGVPVVIHCGSGPLAGEHTGPAPMVGLLERHPGLQLVIAHLGMPEYAEFLTLAERYDGVRLDTTMFGTDFVEALMPFPRELLPRLGALGDKVLLGSDFPTIPYPYAHQLAALHRLGLGEDWLRAVLWHNGARLFGLTDAVDGAVR